MSIQILRIFFMKSEFDYDDPDVDFFKFHPQIKIFLVFNGIFFNNSESYLRFIWPVLSTVLGLVGAAMEIICIYHGITSKDYSLATECFCYFIILTTIPLVYISVLFNRPKLMQLLDSMNRDFVYICSLEPKYRNEFLEGQVLIWQLCIVWFCFTMSIVVMYFTTTITILIYQSLFATQTENMVRQLMFPLWLPADDPYRTPNYEIFMFCQINIAMIVLQTFCVYIYVLFHILLHNYYIMSMVIFDCEILFDGLDDRVHVVELPCNDPRRIEVQLVLNNRMRRIIKWHILVLESIKTVSSIYGPPLVYQVMFSALAICLVAYQVADSLDHGKFHVIFAMLLIACCVQLWIPCYLGTLIRNKAFAVGDVIWSCGWHETPLGRLLRQDIIFIIMRSQRPLSIKFTGLPNVDLETFSSVMSTSYSYFNILRQYK